MKKETPRDGTLDGRPNAAILWLCALLFCGALTLIAGCGADDQANSTASDNAIDAVYVDNYPMFYFASRIGGDDVEVRFPLPEGIDPAFWAPDMDAIRQYQLARLLLFNGADYAKWSEHVSLPDLSIVRTADTFRDQWIMIEDAVAHRHGPEGEAHKHQGVAFTTWLDFRLAEQQAEQAFQAMAKAWPEHRDAMQTRWQELRADLQRLDRELNAANSAYHQQPMVASHPVYQYLARRLGWNLRELHWEPDVVPSDEDWNAFDGLLKEHPAKIMIWEGPPAAETKSRLAERGIECIVYVPCGNRPASGGDFLQVMETNIRTWESAIQNLAE